MVGGWEPYTRDWGRSDRRQLGSEGSLRGSEGWTGGRGLWTVGDVFEGLVLFGWWPYSPSLPHVLREASSSSPALPITLPIPLHIPLPGLPFVAPSASLYNSTFSSPSLPLIPSPYMATVGPASARHPSPSFRKVSSRMPTHHRAPSSSQPQPISSSSHSHSHDSHSHSQRSQVVSSESDVALKLVC